MKQEQIKQKNDELVKENEEYKAKMTTIQSETSEKVNELNSMIESHNEQFAYLNGVNRESQEKMNELTKQLEEKERYISELNELLSKQKKENKIVVDKPRCHMYNCLGVNGRIL